MGKRTCGCSVDERLIRRSTHENHTPPPTAVPTSADVSLFLGDPFGESVTPFSMRRAVIINASISRTVVLCRAVVVIVNCKKPITPRARPQRCGFSSKRRRLTILLWLLRAAEHKTYCIVNYDWQYIQGVPPEIFTLGDISPACSVKRTTRLKNVRFALLTSFRKVRRGLIRLVFFFLKISTVRLPIDT